MKNRILEVIKQNIIGVSIGVIGVISSIVSYFIKANLDTAFVTLRISLVILTFFIIILVLMYIVIRQQTLIHVDNIIIVKRYIKEQDIFLLNSKETIRIGTILAMYYDKGDYKLPFGMVKIINDNGTILQSKLIGSTKIYRELENDVVKRLHENDPNELSRLFIEYRITDEILFS